MNLEKISKNLLELSSEQRLQILFSLLEKEAKISELAKKFDATAPEVHRNFGRLEKEGLISKKTSGSYVTTEYGKVVCELLPSIYFMSKNKKYFENHSIQDIPLKFIQRVGALSEFEQINGFVKVSEKWNEIYDNSEKFIYNTLVEVSYSSEIINTLVKKLKNDIKINSIFSEYANVTKERKQILSKQKISKFLSNDTLKRKMMKGLKILVVLNEVEAGLCFPLKNGDVDMSKMLYSKNPNFHEWVIDYFKYLWNSASTFREDRLNQ